MAPNLSIILVLLKATCLLLIALCATLAMQRASARSRHVVWLVALGALLVLPVLGAWGPLQLRVLPSTAAVGRHLNSPQDARQPEVKDAGSPATCQAASTTSLLQ